MAELMDLTGPDAVRRLEATGVRIPHRFGRTVVVEAPLRDPALADVVRPSPEPTVAEPSAVDPERLGPQAFRLRQTPQWRARKEARPDEGVPLDEIIGGERET